MSKANKLADYLDDNARGELDNEAAAALRKFGRVYEVAYEIVWAKNREHQNNAYKELESLIKGKVNE